MLRHVVWRTCRAGQLNRHRLSAGAAEGVLNASAAVNQGVGRPPVANHYDDDVMKKLWRDTELYPRSEDSWSRLLEAMIFRNERMQKLPKDILPTLSQPLAMERLLVALARVLVPHEGGELLRRMAYIISQQQWSGDFEIGMVCRGLSRLFQNQIGYQSDTSVLDNIHSEICSALFTHEVKLIIRKPNVALEATNFLLARISGLTDSDLERLVGPLLTIVHKACKDGGYSAKMQTSLLPVVAVRASIRCGSLPMVSEIATMALEAVDDFGKKRRIIGSTSKAAERTAAVEAILEVIHLNPCEVNCNIACKLQETILVEMKLSIWTKAVYNTLDNGALDRGQLLMKYVTLSTIHPRFPTHLPQDPMEAEACLLQLLECGRKARFSPLPFLRWALKNSGSSRSAKEEILRMLPDWASEKASLMNELHPGANTFKGNANVNDDYVTIKGCPAGLEGVYKRMGTHNGKNYYIRTEPRKEGPMSLYFTGKVWQLGSSMHIPGIRSAYHCMSNGDGPPVGAEGWVAYNVSSGGWQPIQGFVVLPGVDRFAPVVPVRVRDSPRKLMSDIGEYHENDSVSSEALGRGEDHPFVRRTSTEYRVDRKNVTDADILVGATVKANESTQEVSEDDLNVVYGSQRKLIDTSITREVEEEALKQSIEATKVLKHMAQKCIALENNDTNNSGTSVEDIVSLRQSIQQLVSRVDSLEKRLSESSRSREGVYTNADATSSSTDIRQRISSDEKNSKSNDSSDSADYKEEGPEAIAALDFDSFRSRHTMKAAEMRILEAKKAGLIPRGKQRPLPPKAATARTLSYAWSVNGESSLYTLWNEDKWSHGYGTRRFLS